MKYYDLDPLPIVSGDPAELFFDDREDCEFARTLAARTAAIISQVRRYTVTRYTCPGRQIIVSPSTRTPGGWQVTFYHTDRITGDKCLSVLVAVPLLVRTLNSAPTAAHL